jgi:predicted nuclease of predicted toxin-antitoxin system
VPWVNASDLPREPLSKPEQREFEAYLKKKKIKPRFYSDANFPQWAVDYVRENKFKLVTAKEVGLQNRDDQDHLAYALREARVLLTCDRDFLDERKHPLISCPAIIVFDFGEGTRSEMFSAFHVLWWIATVPEWLDKWAKFEANRDGWTELLRFEDGSTARYRNRHHDGDLQTWVDEPT